MSATRFDHLPRAVVCHPHHWSKFSSERQVKFVDLPGLVFSCHVGLSDYSADAEVFDLATNKPVRLTWNFSNALELFQEFDQNIWKGAKVSGELPQYIKLTGKIERLVEEALGVVEPHLQQQPHALKFFRYFYISAPLITTIVNNSKNIHRQGAFTSLKVPGMHFFGLGLSTEVLLNISKSRVGEGKYGKVKKALWLTAPNGPQILAKKNNGG